MVNIEPRSLPSLREVTNAAFAELYPQVARQQGLSEQQIEENLRRRWIVGKVTFLWDYFTHLTRTQRELLRQKICIEWGYCEKREKYGQAIDWAAYLGDVVVLGIHWGPVTLLWLLMTGFFDEFCGCNPKGIVRQTVLKIIRVIRRPNPQSVPPSPPSNL